MRRLAGWIGGLRFPKLLLILASLLAVDVLVPDPVPFLDEAVLAVLAALVSAWKKRPRRDVRRPGPGGAAPSPDTRNAGSS